MTDPETRAWEEAIGRFWLVVHEPGMVSVRKGPWISSGFKSIIRDFIKAYPTAYLTVLTVDEAGVPHVEHGPEAIQMADGRSMSVGRNHNARTKEAHRAALTPPAIPVDVADLCERLRRKSAFKPTWATSCPLVHPDGEKAATALETLAAENARLHSLAKANNTLARMNGDRATKAEAENARLREALEPFAKAGELFDAEPVDPRYHVVIYGPAAGDEYKITDRHLRAARAALSPVTQVKESRP
jgi:hypothetical protein